MDRFRRRVRYCVLLSYCLDNPHIGCCSDNSRYYLLQKVIGGVFVKVVLLKSPKMLAPVLRAVFKIKKVKSET